MWEWRVRGFSGAPRDAPHAECRCLACEQARASRISPGMLARIYVPDCSPKGHATSWAVGGPLIWGTPLQEGSIVFVVAWSCFKGVDSHLDAVVVAVPDPRRFRLRSTFASSLVPF